MRKDKPDEGTVKRGTAISPWTGEAIDGDYIKAEAQAGRMGQQLYAVKIRKGICICRSPTDEDDAVTGRTRGQKLWASWEAAELIR